MAVEPGGRDTGWGTGAGGGVEAIMSDASITTVDIVIGSAEIRSIRVSIIAFLYSQEKYGAYVAEC